MKKLDSAFGKILISLANLISPSKNKKTLTQEAFQKELDLFTEIYKTNAGASAFDVEEFQKGFTKYLKDKGYSLEGMNVHVKRKMEEDIDDLLPEPKNIKEISEDFNKCLSNIEMVVDTTKMAPGLICYTIEKIEPTNKLPYVRYKPVPRVITQIHDSGVNGGTIFFAYDHKFVSAANFSGKQSGQVISEYEVIYSPLTKEHAIYICKLLNVQSRLFYQKMLKQQNTK